MHKSMCQAVPNYFFFAFRTLSAQAKSNAVAPCHKHASVPIKFGTCKICIALKPWCQNPGDDLAPVKEPRQHTPQSMRVFLHLRMLFLLP